MMKDLPQDPVMLYSLLNTLLRDSYPSLAALCEDRELSEKDLLYRLSEAGFSYDRDRNRFV